MSSNPLFASGLDSEQQRHLILVESRERWCLARRPDPRLKVGTVFEYNGDTWVVTWDSGVGFGDVMVN